MTKRGVLFICIVMLAQSADALRVVSHISPMDRERARRPETRFIVLHTTEGPATGSLRKIHENGEAHYVVIPSGKIYRTVSRSRVAYHAGLSMWDGKRDIDTCSVAIEVVGYHDKSITPEQYGALKGLLDELQRMYRIPDDRVLCHAMVAYGDPNRWHSRAHRGRKRCGMLFARTSVRLKLGLTGQPLYDPDVRAGRLVVGDPYLMTFMYGTGTRPPVPVGAPVSEDTTVITAHRSAWDIAKSRYNRPETTYVFPDGRRFAGNEIKDWKTIPAGTRVITGAE